MKFRGFRRALEAVAEMYRYEAGLFGVDSVILEAGAFPTSAALKNLLPADAARAAGYGAVGELPDKIFGAFEERLRRPGGPDPQADAVAALILRLACRGSFDASLDEDFTHIRACRGWLRS